MKWRFSTIFELLACLKCVNLCKNESAGKRAFTNCCARAFFPILNKKQEEAP